MLPTRIIRTCYCFKVLNVSRNMSIAVSTPNSIPQHLCDLAKQLNVNNVSLAKVFNNHQDRLNSFTESRWIVLFKYLSQYDFKTSDILEMVDSNPDILSVNRQNLHKCMQTWTSIQFDDKKLRELLIIQPSCLLLDDKHILSRVSKLLAYVGNKHNRVLELISYSPNVLFDNWKHLETKFDYIMLNMELSPSQFVKTNALSMTLFEIKCRHNFLVRLGMYKYKDPKNNPNLATENPSLTRIIEASDKQFATKVAGVTAEEYFVFKKLYKKQLDEENDNSDDEDYSDDDS